MNFINKIKIHHISLAFFIGVLFVVFFFTNIHRDSEKNILKSDFIPFYSAAQIINDGKVRNIYNRKLQSEYFIKSVSSLNSTGFFLAYINLPAPALLYLPFIKFSVILAFKLFAIVNFIILLIAITFVLKSAPQNIILYLLLPWFLPLYASVNFGQLSIILLLILVLLYACLKNERSFMVGLLCGMLALKFQYLLIVPFLILIVKNKRQFIYGLILIISTYLSINVSLYGVSIFKDYLSTFGAVKANHADGFFYNIFALSKYINLNIIFLLVVMLFILAIFLIHYYKSRVSIDLLFASIILFTLSLSFHTMYTDLIFLLIPFCFLFGHPIKILRYLLTAIILLSCFLASKGTYVLTGFLFYLIGSSSLLFIKKPMDIK